VSDSVAIRSFRADEWDDFVVRARAFYVADMVAAGVDRDVAEAKADNDFVAVLPDGLETKDHLFFMIEDAGEPAGYLWLAERQGELGHHLFVYGIEIDESHRGRGVGRAAMELAEAGARRLGIPRIALNVFGGNDVARGLYASLGYRETAVFMEKTL
jgi:ribosomal protein S18 acetylase RimI-like enzyme